MPMGSGAASGGRLGLPPLGDLRPRRSGRRAAVAVVGVVAVGLPMLAASRAPAAPPPSPGPPVATPILSVRRAPVWIETELAAAGRVRALLRVLRPLQAAQKSSCLVVSEDGQTLLADHPDQGEIPASNMKVLTMTAVLQRLGASTTIPTRVAVAAPIVRGVLHGNLYLIGGGDPLLRDGNGYVPDQDEPEGNTTSLPALAALVKRAGITSITGDVIGDGSLFDSRTTVAGWRPEYSADEDVGPIDALDVNDGFSPEKPDAPAAQPALMTARVFAGLLSQAHVKLRPKAWGQGRTPAGARVVASISSAPLGLVAGTILQASDDTGAEILTKLLGARVTGQGTTAAGTAVVRATLASDGLPVAGFVNDDGSGLDRSDRASCALMAGTLTLDGTSGPVFAGLPVAAESGTLSTVMIGTPAAGRIHAKTGTLDSVFALSGFAMPPTVHRAGPVAPGGVVSVGGDGPPWDAPPVVFSLITNGEPSVYVGIQVASSLGVRLCAEPRVPPLAALEPLP